MSSTIVVTEKAPICSSLNHGISVRYVSFMNLTYLNTCIKDKNPLGSDDGFTCNLVIVDLCKVVLSIPSISLRFEMDHGCTDVRRWGRGGATKNVFLVKPASP